MTVFAQLEEAVMRRVARGKFTMKAAEDLLAGMEGKKDHEIVRMLGLVKQG